MTTATYPITLPRPQGANYSYELHRPVTVTASDRGCGRVRPIGNGLTTVQSLMWVFTDADLATWVVFWRDTILAGSLPFSIPLLTAFIDEAVIVQPMGPYTQEANNGRWKVTLPVEWLAPPDVIAASDLPGIISSFADISAASALHYVVHTVLPASIP